LMKGDFSDTATNISETLRLGLRQSKDSKRKTIGRMGNLIILFFILISSTPVIFLVDRINEISLCLKVLISAGYIIAYSTILVAVLLNEVKKAENEGSENGKFKKMPWIFDFNQHR